MAETDVGDQGVLAVVLGIVLVGILGSLVFLRFTELTLKS